MCARKCLKPEQSCSASDVGAIVTKHYVNNAALLCGRVWLLAPPTVRCAPIATSQMRIQLKGRTILSRNSEA